METCIKEIPLTKNQIAIVDEEDYERLIKFHWCADKDVNTYYARRIVSVNGKRRGVKMHREVLGLTWGDGKMVDHINRNGLDNRKCNLRLVTPSQSGHNRRTRSDNKSGYRGVNWSKGSKLWVVRFGTEGKRYYCGRYKELEKAALAYDKVAFKMIGNEAQLNFPNLNHFNP
jgi:hypothetical protein